jgi:outer membrane protein assembly factor BamB
MFTMKKSNYALVIFTFVLTLSAFFCLVSSPAALGSATSYSSNWPMFHHDLTHSGYSTSTPTATNATLLWNFKTNSPVGASPAIVNGLVYIGSDGGIAYCLNASDGSEIWNFTVATTSRGFPGAGGPAISSSMAVANGYVYFGCYDRNVYCLNASTGEKVWNFTTGNTVESCPSVANGHVYVGSWDGNVYCFDAATGAKIWNYSTGGLVESSPAAVGDHIYVGSINGNVYCLDALSGAKIWNYTTGNVVQSSPAVVDGRLYIGSEDDNVYCLNASNGIKIWNYPTLSWVDSSPAVANGYVYVGTGESANPDKNVYCLNALTGAKIWNYTTQDGVDSSPAIAAGYVYVGGWDGNVYCLNASSGANIWTYTTGNHVSSSPAVWNGIVYVGSWDHHVYAFGNQLTTSTPSPGTQPMLSTAEIIYLAAVVIVVVAIAAVLIIFRHKKLHGQVAMNSLKPSRRNERNPQLKNMISQFSVMPLSFNHAFIFSLILSRISLNLANFSSSVP